MALVNGVVVGAFGGHCDLFNYTGMLVAVSTTPGVGIASIFAMESSPGAPPIQTDFTVQNGGKAGIWQSGMAISVDSPTSRIFVATGSVSFLRLTSYLKFPVTDRVTQTVMWQLPEEHYYQL